ncbi:hypothetical protein [uncultured Muribaculum sp.]|uniref:hypothetical protein n=1 Tax=uncultured Muribaculum sp. TaxID=1918613 RepID=UPI0025DA1486|nr:hypothetical protein [uncultured Muribaculum sp.]
MKLHYNRLWLLGALALGMAACSDDEYTGEPQVIPQPDVLPANSVAGIDIYAPGTTVDINAESADIDKMMPLLNLTKIDPQPAGYEVKVQMIMAKTEAELSDPAARRDTILTVLDPQGGALQTLGLSAKALNLGFHSLYGTDDTPRTVALRFDAYSVKDQTSALLGTVGTTGTVTVKPVQYAYTPENSYWVVNPTDPSQKYKMSNGDKAPYENGTFSAVAELPVGTFDWKIVPGSMVDNPVAAMCFGPSSSDEGKLLLGGEAGKVAVEGDKPVPYMFTVDMTAHNADYTALVPTYEVKIAYDVLYVLGDAQGGNSTPAVLTTKDYVTYGGFVPFKGWGAKMSNIPTWDGTEFANFKFDGPDANGAYTGTVGTGGDGGNIVGLPDGIYAWVFNITSGVVTATPIEHFELIGTAIGGWDDGDVQKLAPVDAANAACAEFSAEIDFKSTGEFKLRGIQPKLNNNWAFSLGGPLDALVWDGPNSSFEGAPGKHTVTISFNVAKEGEYAESPRVHYVIK